jgi:hypothetical protein
MIPVFLTEGLRERHADLAAVAHRLRRRADLGGADHGQLRGKRFPGDEVRVRADRVGHLAVRADRQGDPVGDVEPGVLPCLLDDPYDVAGGALGDELGSHRRVKRDEAVATRQGRRRVRVRGGQLEFVLPWPQFGARGGHDVA